MPRNRACSLAKCLALLIATSLLVLKLRRAWQRKQLREAGPASLVSLPLMSMQEAEEHQRRLRSLARVGLLLRVQFDVDGAQSRQRCSTLRFDCSAAWMANWQSGCTQMQHVVVQQRVNSSIPKDCPDEGTFGLLLGENRRAAHQQRVAPADLTFSGPLYSWPHRAASASGSTGGGVLSPALRIMNTGVLSMSETERRIMRAAGLTTFIWSTEIAGGYGESSGPCRDSGYGRWLSACGPRCIQVPYVQRVHNSGGANRAARDMVRGTDRDVLLTFVGDGRAHRKMLLGQLLDAERHREHNGSRRLFLWTRWSELHKSALRQTHRRDRNATKHTHKLQLAEMVEIGVHAAMSQSQFCLQPPGDSLTRASFYDALLRGCVPVIFRVQVQSYNELFAKHLPIGRLAVVVDIDPWATSPTGLSNGETFGSALLRALASVPSSSLDRIRKQIALLWPFLQFAAHAGELDALAVALGTVYKIARERGVAQATNRLANRILDQRRELLGPTRAEPEPFAYGTCARTCAPEQLGFVKRFPLIGYLLPMRPLAAAYYSLVWGEVCAEADGKRWRAAPYVQEVDMLPRT